MEIKAKEQKIKLGSNNFKKILLISLKDKKLNDVITVKVKSTNSKGILVTPENNDTQILIKKSNIAINAEDARSIDLYLVIVLMLLYQR